MKYRASHSTPVTLAAPALTFGLAATTRSSILLWKNVIPVLASFDNPRLPPAAVDLVLVVDTFHHIDQRLGYFQRLSGVLRPGGRIAIIDWRIDRLPVGPPPDHKIAREQVIAEMEAAGYRLVDERPTLLPYHYFLVFQPS